MNLWVLFLCSFLVHSRIKKRRIFLFSLIAALGQTLILCIPIGNSSFKIIVGFGGITAFSIYLLFRPKTWEYFYRLLGFSYLSAGILGASMTILEMLMSGQHFSLWELCIFVTVATELIKIVYLKICVKSIFSEVELTLAAESKCTVTALIDSGNGLIEPLSKTPVSIIEKASIEKYQKELKAENFRVVPFTSVGKEKGMLEAYFIEKLVIKKDGESIVVEKPMIAITKDTISAKKDYQMILHPALLEI